MFLHLCLIPIILWKVVITFRTIQVRVPTNRFELAQDSESSLQPDPKPVPRSNLSQGQGQIQRKNQSWARIRPRAQAWIEVQSKAKARARGRTWSTTTTIKIDQCSLSNNASSLIEPFMLTLPDEFEPFQVLLTTMSNKPWGFVTIQVQLNPVQSHRSHNQHPI